MALFDVTLTADTVAVTDGAAAQVVPSLEIANARSLRATRVRIDFNDLAVINAALIDPASYQFTPISAGAVPIVAQSVDLPPGQTQPAFVEVVVNEMTDGAIYEAALVGAIVSKDGEPAIATPFPFAGKGASPEVFLVLALDKNTVQVQFTEVMLDNPAIRDPGNYSFDNGLVVTSVEAVEGSRVTLKTTDQTAGLLYSLTVRGILSVVIEDAVATTDMVDTPGLVQLSINDNILVTDSVFTGFGVAGGATDSIAVTDSVSVAKVKGIEVSDSVAVTDSVNATTALPIEIVISDSAVVTDSATAFSYQEPDAIFTGSQQKFWGRGDTFVPGTGGVSEVTDKFGVGPATGLPQATDSLQPDQLPTGGPNSTPCFDSDGSEYVGDNGPDWLGTDASWTMYILCQPRGSISGTTSFPAPAMGTRWHTIGTANTPAWSHSKILSTQIDVQGTTLPALNTWAVIRARWIDDTTLGIRVNNDSESTVAGNSFSSQQPLAMFIRANLLGTIFQGRVADVVAVANTPSAAQDTAMAKYFNGRYGTLEIPTLTW